MHSARGATVDSSRRPTVDTPQAKAGLDILVNGFATGLIPRKAITYKEEEGRRAFEAGELVFHRQWPYQWALANKTDGSSQVAGRFGVTQLPGVNGPGISSLGGHNFAISAFARNKATTALDFIRFGNLGERGWRPFLADGQDCRVPNAGGQGLRAPADPTGDTDGRALARSSSCYELHS